MTVAAKAAIMRRLARRAGAALAVGAVCAATAACGASSSASSPPRLSAAIANPDTGPVGPLEAPGGPFLYDRDGRVVLMHGVDLVYKVPPYEVEVDGSGPNVLTVPEVRRMRALGFDVVRLGIIWRGLEPGTDPIDDRAVCARGTPRANGPGSGQFDAAAFDRYLHRLDATIDLLSRYGISSLLDMHQDVYNEAFGGEGAPDWAVCTDGRTPRPRRHVPDWSVNLQGPGVAAAYGHFWRNDVVGDLQGSFDALWTRIAAHYRGNPWVIGYDPFNEPYAEGLPPKGQNTAFDAELQCFYMGRAHPGANQAGAPVSCPPDDPRVGLIPRIEVADPTHLVFYEPDYTTDSSVPNHIGPMAAPRLVLNFHDYCFLHVPNGPEPPGFGATCGPLERTVFTERDSERARDATPEQPGGPAWILTEFGATTDASDLARITGDADAELTGWMYWQWIHYDDPTGSHTSGLWPPGPATTAQLAMLSRTYASAVAGTPTAMSFDPTTARFELRYRPDPEVHAPTVVDVPVAVHYPQGFCTVVRGGHVVPAGGRDHVDVVASPGAASVAMTIRAGRC
jgi:endoglycosylceramidase